MEAAVESAVKALVNQWPEEYDKRHLKGDAIYISIWMCFPWSCVFLWHLQFMYLISEEESIFKEHSTKNRRSGPPLGPPIPQANRAAPAVASHSGLASVGEDVEDMDAGGWDWVWRIPTLDLQNFEIRCSLKQHVPTPQHINMKTTFLYSSTVHTVQ